MAVYRLNTSLDTVKIHWQVHLYYNSTFTKLFGVPAYNNTGFGHSCLGEITEGGDWPIIGLLFPFLTGQ